MPVLFTDTSKYPFGIILPEASIFNNKNGETVELTV
jgi:hypothetical protein